MNNTMQRTYRFSLNDIITSHFPRTQSYVHDVESDEINMHLQARVRSGDYFMTVATELERIVQNLDQSETAQAADLERIVTELLILSKNYTLIKK